MKKIILIASFILANNVSFSNEGGYPGVFTNSITESIVRFYPNPATTVVNFDFQKGYERGYSIQIFNFLGRKMFEAGNLPQKTTVNLSDFTRGVYIYQLFDRTGKMVESGKFQVSK